MPSQWMPVKLLAEWTDPANEHTVNVGKHLLVIGLLMEDDHPSHALVIRQRYMGSQVIPAVQVFTETVGIGRIRLLGPYIVPGH